MTEEHVGAADMASCTCEPCKRKHGLPNSVRNGTINSYSSTPRNGWTVRRTTAETACGSHAPTFGVELETSVPRRQYRDLPGRPNLPYLAYSATATERDAWDARERECRAYDLRNRAYRARQAARWAAEGDMTGEEAVSMASPRGLWHAKHDGSVSGPEFASQPATLAYWHAAKPHLSEMFRSLLHGGIRSHDGDTCGLHVNIGNDAFADASHLERFAALVCANPRWSVRMAQRTHESMRHWARFDALSTNERRARWAHDVFSWGFASQDRYTVLNASNSGRIEFRLPRGTLRVDRFYAKLEWTAAMVEFTRDAANVPQVSAFVHWCEQRPDEYPALLAFVRERFSGRLAATGGVE